MARRVSGRGSPYHSLRVLKFYLINLGFMKNEIKVWGGFGVVAVIFVCAFAVFKFAEQSQNMSNLQLVATECKLDKNDEKCQK